MKNRFAWAALAVFCMSSLACITGGGFSDGADSARLQNDSAIVSGTLENGLSYRILKNQYPENRISLRLVIKAGSVQEAENQRGLAHLVEHMAFQGTSHFTGNELVHYFESIGMGFGPDLNAYTSFDETVYMLEIPADNPEALSAGLTAIYDWACGVRFDQAALEKERGVVLEELRLGMGVTKRAWDALMPFLFPFSRYANRSPAGSADVIRNAPRKRIVDFYDKWYRPELMTVIIAGDADSAALEKALVERLSAIPAGAKKTKAAEYRVFNLPIKLSLRFQDPEAPYTQVFMGSLFPAVLPKTAGVSRLLTALDIARTVLNARLNERVQDGDSLLNAENFVMEALNSMSAGIVWFSPRNEKFTAAFEAVLDETDRFAQFGVTPGELERHKANLRAGALNARQDRKKTESRTMADRLVYSAINNTPLLSPDDQYNLAIDTINGITIDEVNSVIRQYYGGRGTRLVVSTPNDSGIPSKAGIDRIWKNYRSRSLAPYDDSLDGRPLFPPPSGVKSGAVVSERNIPGSGENPAIVELTLSNGAKVIVCPTDFREDRLVFNAVSRGGLSLFDDAGYPSASCAANYVFFSGLNGFKQTDVTKKLAGKTAEVGLSLNETGAGLWGSAASRDMETLFQLANLYLSSPWFTGPAWERIKSNVASRIEAVQKYPHNFFSNEMSKFIYRDSVRFTEANPAFLAGLDSAAAERAYRRLFGDAGSFTFIFTGDVNIDEIKRLSAAYLASLPSAGTKNEAKNNYPPFPEGRQTLKIRKGIAQQGRVALVFGGDNPEIEGDPLIEQDLIRAMTELIEIRLREKIREKMGASYGVGVECWQINYPSRLFGSQISFGCEPAREEELAELVINELRAMQENPPPTSSPPTSSPSATTTTPETAMTADLVKLRESFIRGRETGVKTNDFWQRAIIFNVMRGETGAGTGDSESVLAALNDETMRRLVTRYFNTRRCVTGFLLPE
jgi:zinc protease